MENMEEKAILLKPSQFQLIIFYSIFLLLALISGNYAPTSWPFPTTVTGQEHCCQSHSPLGVGTGVNVKVNPDDPATPTLTQSLKGIQVEGDLKLGQCASQEGVQGPVESCPGSSTPKIKRYILYDINPGEGFNLRRDIFVRIAPLVKALNEEEVNVKVNAKVKDDDPTPIVEWTLVLPPWRRLPHWRDTPLEKSFPWSTFFSLENISKYIPVMELDAFLHEHHRDLKGPRIDIDTVINLSHFPFPKPGEENEVSWEEAVKVDTDCGMEAQFILDDASKLFHAAIWGRSLTIREIQCVSLRGTAATLRPLLQGHQGSRSILLQNAEVILWDEYGGEEWWKARASLKFAQNLIDIAKSYAIKNLDLDLDKAQDGGYLSLHLRRRDFLQRSSSSSASDPPSLQEVAHQIRNICKNLGISSLFLATDAENDEISVLKSLLSQDLKMWTHPCENLSEGECAIIDQILASRWSTHFLGTEGSTFTLRIFEERLLLGKSPDSTYNYICAKTMSKSPKSTCPTPTRWMIPNSLRHLINVTS